MADIRVKILVFQHDGTVVSQYLLGEGVHAVGRDPNSAIYAESEYISNEHAKLHLTEEGIFIEDLNSTSGTFLDDITVRGKIRLNPGQRLQIGDLYIDLQLEGAGDLSPGAKIGAGRYQLIKELGRGAMGQVWLGEDTQLNEQVAIKVLGSDVANDAVSLLDLKREVQKSRKLSHDNIIRIHDLVQLPGENPFITLEYVQGTDLHVILLNQPDHIFQWPDVKPYVLQLCEALDYAHERKIVHRDLKPSNIMITQDGVLKLADFGIAASIADATGRSSMANVASGTPQFMSPQQMLGESPKASDDIYALGSTIYNLLTGRPPFHTGDIVQQVHHVTPTPIAQRMAEFGLKNSVPDYVNSVVLSCLAKDPAARPASAGAIAEWIRTEGKSDIPAKPKKTETYVGEVMTAEPPAKDKKPTVLTIAAVAVIAVILGVLFLGRSEGKDENQNQGDSSQAEGKEGTEGHPVTITTPKPPVPHATYWKENWYAVFPGPLHWTIARATAEDLGGHLVTIETADENNLVAGLIRDKKTHHEAGWWIGGNCIDQDGNWRWLDKKGGTKGELLRYQNWTKDHPHQHASDWDYFLIRKDGKWNVHGAIGSGFIVEWEKSDTTNSKSDDNKQTTPDLLMDGLIAYYSFDDKAKGGDGNKLDGIIRDNSGNGCHLINVGANPTSDRHGKPGQAFQFTGKEYLRLVRTLPDMPKQTIAAWVKNENTPELMGTIFSDLTVDGGNDLMFLISPNGGRVRADKTGAVLGVEGDPTGGLFSFPKDKLPGKRWFQVVWVLEEKSSKIYLNGVETTKINATGSNVGYHQAEIGRWNHRFGARDYFKGAMDDIRIYNRALSAEEITALYDLEKPSSEKGISVQTKTEDEIASPKVVISLEHTDSVYTVTWSPDGKQLATTGGDSTLKIWDGATGKTIKTIIGPVPELSTKWSPSVSWSPDGRKIVSNSNDPNGHLRVWDITTGKLIHSIQAHSSYGLGGAWSPNGKHFGSSGGDRAVRVWNAVTGEKVLEMHHSHYAYCMAWNPVGTKIASGSYDKTLRVWDATTGEELNQFKGHTGVIRGFSWSPDGTKLASGGGEPNDRSLRIWDLANNKLIYQVDDAHTRDVARVKWSPDGKKIASTGQDNVLRISDAQTGKLLFEQQLSGQDISWHPDSRRLATVYGVTENPDRTICIWFIPAKIKPTPTPGEIAIEQAVQKVLGKSSGQLKQADYDQVSDLDLSNKNIKDISSLTKFQKLKKLNLRGNLITDFNPLSNLPALEYLFFSTDGVSIDHLRGLGKLESAAELHLERTRNMNNGTYISSIVDNSPNLRRLYLYLPGLYDRSPIYGLKDAKLELIDMTHAPQPKDVRDALIEHMMPDTKIIFDQK